jgi:GTP-binding protein
VDAIEGAGDREGAIAGEAEQAGCGIVIAVNKWDLVKGRGQDFVEKFDDKLRFQLKFLEFAPIVHISALTGDRTDRLLQVVARVAEARARKVPTSELNRVLERVTAAHSPTSKSRREVRILYAAQNHTNPPGFVLFTNVASELHFSYERYLTNQLRKAFGFEGTPIRLTIRRRERAEKGKGQRAEGKGRTEGKGALAQGKAAGRARLKGKERQDRRERQERRRRREE